MRPNLRDLTGFSRPLLLAAGAGRNFRVLMAISGIAPLIIEIITIILVTGDYNLVLNIIRGQVYEILPDSHVPFL
jgi:hypothetical protein